MCPPKSSREARTHVFTQILRIAGPQDELEALHSRLPDPERIRELEARLRDVVTELEKARQAQRDAEQRAQEQASNFANALADLQV